MFAVSTYDEIVQNEKMVDNFEIVVLLFVRPTSSISLEVIKEFAYIHYNSGKYCSIYAVGYSDSFDKQEDIDYDQVCSVNGIDWHFSHKAFVEFKNKLENRINWRYSGEIEALILQNNPNYKDSLNFKNYVAININKGLREGYLDSFQLFMESLIRSSKSKVTAIDVISNVHRSRFSIKETISLAIKDCKKIPKPVRSIISDRMFYKSANNIFK